MSIAAPERLAPTGGGADEAACPTPPHEIAGPADAPVVVALGGISATRHVVSTPDDPSPGWWQCAAGPGAGLDTTRYRVMGMDFLDGGRAPSGRPARIVTTADQARALARVLDGAGIAHVHAVVGASYGGMVALAFAALFPSRLERLVVISAAHESHPMATALRSLQRRVVELGLDSGRGRAALALARGIAMTTYRTAREFAGRFATAPVEVGADQATFEVERYLAHCGERFADAFAPARFLALSLSGDLHHVDPTRVATRSVLVAAEDDALVPLWQMEVLAHRLAGPARLEHVQTRFGHDAFLREPVAIGRILTAALSEAVES